MRTAVKANLKEIATAEGRPPPITLDHFSEAVVAAVTRTVTSNKEWRDKIIRMGGRFEVFVDVGGIPQEGYQAAARP